MPAEDNQALIRFIAGWAEAGVSEDGLPRYRETVRIIKSVPPYTEVEHEASDVDIANFPEAYEVFQREQAARALEPGETGFPLALWPVVSPAAFKTLTARGIVTVEQLAARRNDPAMPGLFKTLADRAHQMIALSADVGKYEAMLRELTGQRDVLLEEVNEMKATISAQNSMINSLKMRAA